jgi:aspartate aminotransferase-like enzyme
MFGPNTHLSTTTFNIKYSHRDIEFIDLYKRLNGEFVSKFNLQDYDVLFIPGGGTIGIESVFWSLKKQINVIGHEGVFTERWNELSELYVPEQGNGIDLYCQLETSVNKVFEKEGCIVDAISSFPYYDIPNDTKIFITCSNKQLGSIPGLAIVCVRKDYWGELENDNIFSYLNLARYKKYGDKNQTPSTPPITVYENLACIIQNFDVNYLREKIHKNSQKLIEIFGGEVSPVFVIDKKRIPIEYAKLWKLYGLNTSSKHYSIFTYSCKDDEYKKFVSGLK